jgi:hypothetical protein
MANMVANENTKRPKFIGSFCCLLAVLFATIPAPANATLNLTDITLFAVVRDGIKYGEQDNQPLFVESVSPTPGHPWDWQVSGLSGFAPTANITFAYQNDGAGQPNELHTEATMTWSGFQASEWASGNSGSFTLTLTNGVDPDRNYTINLALRSLPSIEFTVIENQSQAETDPICAAPASGSPYTWSASGVSGIAPTPTISFTFDGGDTDKKDGRVAVSFAGDWSNQNGNFTLTLKDGSRPDSIFDGSRAGAGESLPSLSLRSLIGDGYTVIENQSSGGDGVSAAGANGFTFSASGYSGLSPAPTTLTFNAMGAARSLTAAAHRGWIHGDRKPVLRRRQRERCRCERFHLLGIRIQRALTRPDHSHLQRHGRRHRFQLAGRYPARIGP